MSKNSASGVCISPTAHITDPHLKQVLKTYAAAAMNSLNGPGSFQDSWTATNSKACLSRGPARKPGDSLPPFPVQPAPVFCLPEQTTSERCDTVLEGEKISGFVVGGEMRLCLPQLLNTVFSTFGLPEINAVCDDLQVYISPCSTQQLNCLKTAKILPMTAPSCGLITLTDAERLCGALLHRKSDCKIKRDQGGRRSVPVEHRCFGRMQGTAYVDLLTRADAPCIECLDCQGLFSPRHFVLHCHKSMEQGVCHWGFDSSNWRRYLFIPEEVGPEAVQKFQPMLEELKSKFLKSRSVPCSKGSLVQLDDSQLQQLPSKRIKIEEAVYPGGLYAAPVAWYIPSFGPDAGNATGLLATPNDLASVYTHGAIPVNNVSVVTSSAHFPSFLNRGPPDVINPERIVLSSHTEKCDEKFQPNVALVPRSTTVIQRNSDALTHAFASCSSAVAGSSSKRPCSPGMKSPFQPLKTPSSATHRVAGSHYESDDETSSNSTLSIDFGQEKAILDEDENELNSLLVYLDDDTRSKFVHGIDRLKHRCATMLLKAQHDKDHSDKELQYYKFVRKEKIRELKNLLAVSQRENGSLKLQLEKQNADYEELQRRFVELSQKCKQDLRHDNAESGANK